MHRRKKRIILYSLIAALVFAMIGAAWGGSFHFRSVCEKCGAIKRTTDWQFPFTRWSIFEHSSVMETPVSQALATNGIINAHDHQWLFACGGGNGVTCALGKGSQIQFTVEDKSVAHMLDTLHRNGELSFRNRVLTNLFRNRTTYFVRLMPKNIPGNKEEIQQWISEQSKDLDEMAPTPSRK